MNTSIATEQVSAQATEIPSIYGRVDFSITPERFTAAPTDQTELAPQYLARRPELLANQERVALITAYTMTGDHVADAYAALIPTCGFKRLVAMLEQACDRGVESVPAAPPELARFIREMEPLAIEAFRRGRTSFTPTERARVELARYRCFLLGLPQELLPDTPQGIASILLTRHATLRKGFDDTCIDLVRATMDADLTTDRSLPDRLHEWIEHGFARVCFVPKFLRRGKHAASGIHVGLADYIGAAAAGILIAIRMTAYAIAERIPIISRAADRSLVRKLTKQLARYGHAEFTTNADTYRPAHA